MNVNLLKSKMALFGDKDVNLANYLEIVPSAVSAKFSGKAEFSRMDIEKIIKRYNLTSDEVVTIFFN